MNVSGMFAKSVGLLGLLSYQHCFVMSPNARRQLGLCLEG